jgi:hypothetical protein
MAIEDMLVTKLRSLTEHNLRYETPVAISRALREQIDWDEVRDRTADSPFARAFFTLVEGLGIVEPAAPRRAAESSNGVGVRVLTRSAAASAG